MSKIEEHSATTTAYTAYTSSVPFYVSIVTYSTQMQYWSITHLCLLKIYVLKLSKSLKKYECFNYLKSLNKSKCLPSTNP
jgi:hypothetical protein